MNQENVENQEWSFDFYKIIGVVIAVLIFLGSLYFLWYVFYGYDSNSRVQLLDAMSDFVDFRYFPINKNSPFFAFNFCIQIFIITIAVAILQAVINKVRLWIFGDKSSDYDSAMNLLFEDNRFRFRYISPGYKTDYGWDNPEGFEDKIQHWLGVIFGISRKIFGGKIHSILIGNNIKSERDAGNTAVKRLKSIQEDEAIYGKACYHRALLCERVYWRWRHQFYDKDAELLFSAMKFFEIALNNDVELTEYQYGMLLIQYADKLSSDKLNANKKGVELLKVALTKIPVGRDDIKNMCHITIANVLSESDNSPDLDDAIFALNHIDVNEKLTAKIHFAEIFIRNPLASRNSKIYDEMMDYLSTNKSISFSERYRRVTQDKNGIIKRQIIAMNFISIKDLNYKLTEKLDLARKKEIYMAAEAEKRRATENLMAMFAHKFRGPVDSIIFNTQHKHDERIYLDAARTMTGLLEVFSIVSTEPERLVESMKSDVCGDGSPEKTILRSMKFALMQLLTRRNIKRMSRHYWQYALRLKLIPESTRFKDWNSESYLSILEIEIQEKLEMEVSSITIEHGVKEIETWMRSNLMMTEIQVSDTRQIRFSEYGRKEALLTTIMTELFVNAIKHTDVTSTQSFKVSWDEQADGLVFKCTNPSNRESRSGLSRGSGRGHSFLKMLLEKMQGQFEADVYQELSVVSVVIPYSLLIGERS